MTGRGASERDAGGSPLPNLGRPALERTVAGVLAHGSLRLAQIVLLLSAIGALALLRSSPSYWTLAAGGTVALVAIAANAGARKEMALWLGYVGLFVMFAQLRGTADEFGSPVRYDYVIELDRLLFGTDPTVWLQANLAAVAPVADYVAIGTHLSYFLVPQVLAAVLLIRKHRRAFVYLAALLTTVYAGLLVCYLVPTAPPWLASRAELLPPVERVLEERVFSLDPRAMESGESFAGVNHVAAMPSLHVALPAVMVGLAWGAKRYWRWLAAGYCGLMGVSLVYLGEHYAVDVLAGIALGLAAWALVRVVFDSAVFRSPLARGRPDP